LNFFKNKGEWKGKTAGGCKNHKTFKNNKQFHIYVPETTRATIVLSQTEHDKFDPLGIYVVKAPGLSQFFSFLQEIKFFGCLIEKQRLMLFLNRC
jgi:hypothetical protein